MTSQTTERIDCKTKRKRRKGLQAGSRLSNDGLKESSTHQEELERQNLELLSPHSIMETEDHKEIYTEGTVTGPILPVLLSYKFVVFTDRVCGDRR